MKFDTKAFFLFAGLLAGFMAGIVVTTEMNLGINKEWEAKRACEKSLPRDQVCEVVITAVPVLDSIREGLK